MTDVLIVVPVLNRPANARPLVESILETANVPWLLVFVCTSGDDAEVDAVFAAREFSDRVGISFLSESAGPGDYARKIQVGYDSPMYVDVPIVLLAADDLRFHPGWDTAALELFETYDVGVVGTVDLGNRGTMSGLHSTHPFVSRCYIDRHGGVVGEPGVVYHQGYDHQFVDSEMCATAMVRGCYAHSQASVIEHLHPLWNKAETDETYRKGARGFSSDRALFEKRRKLWEGLRV